MSESFALACYRAVVALYPPAFRALFADELLLTFADQLRDASRGGTPARARFAVAIAVDVVRSLAAEYAAAAFATPARLRRSTTVAAAAMTSALALAGLLASFVCADVTVFRPLPYPHADRLVRVQTVDAYQRHELVSESALARVAALPAFARYGAYDAQVRLGEMGVRRLTVVRVSGDMFGTLGARVQLGRPVRIGEPGVALLDGSVWRDGFDADTSVIGRELVVQGSRYHIVGVLDDSFALPDGRANAYITAPLPAPRTTRALDVVGVYALLRGDETLARASAVAARGAALAGDERLRLVPFAQTAPAVQRAVVALLAVAAVLALLALANAARALRRLAPFARAFLYALAAGIGALVAVRALPLAEVGTALLLPHVRPFAVDARTMPMVAAMCAVAALAAFGGRFTALHRRHRALPLASAGAALVLTVAATVAVAHWHDGVVRTGVTSDDRRIETVFVLDPKRYGGSHAIQRFRTALVTGVRAVPGVTRAAAGIGARFGTMTLDYMLARDAAGRAIPPVTAAYVSASPGFLALAGIPVVRGRDVTIRDDAAHRHVVLIDEAFARRYFGAADPIGRDLRLDDVDGARARVVGIVASIPLQSIDDAPRPILVEPSAQRPLPMFTLIVDSSLTPYAVAEAIRGAVAAADPSVPPPASFGAAGLLDRIVAPRRVVAWAAAAAALLAWAICAVSLGTFVPRRRGKPARCAGLYVDTAPE